MYSDLHVAIDTRHCIHGNSDSTGQYTYNITYPTHVQQHACSNRHASYEWQYGYDNYTSSKTISHSSNTYKTSLYQNSTIHSICTQHYIYGNILACNITNIQPIHMQPHICNKTHVILISSNAQIQQHVHYKCV